jgi:hypothetical protein
LFAHTLHAVPCARALARAVRIKWCAGELGSPAAHFLADLLGCDGTARAARQAAEAATSRPRLKIAPRWVLMPAVACSIDISAAMPCRRNVWNGAALAPASATAMK